MIRLLFEAITDVLVRDNFKSLQDYLSGLDLLKPEFRFYEKTFNSAVTDFAVPHNLNKIPKDAFITRVSDGATVSFDYDLFDREYIYVTTSAACTVRYFLGGF